MGHKGQNELCNRKHDINNIKEFELKVFFFLNKHILPSAGLDTEPPGSKGITQQLRNINARITIHIYIYILPLHVLTFNRVDVTLRGGVWSHDA